MTTQTTDLIFQLRATLGKMEVALGLLSDAIVWTDYRGSIQWCNGSFDRLVGKPHIEVLSAPLTELLLLEQGGRILPPEEHPVQLLLNAQSGLLGQDYEFRQADKKLVVEVFAEPLEFNEQPMAAVFVIRDITERLKTQQALQQQAVQLQAANKELEAFSYSISHDLRTPLRAIEGFSGILLEEYSSRLDAEGQRLLRIVRTNTERMGHLIDDLLTFSRLGRQPVQRVEIDMEQLVRSVFEELKMLVPGRKIQLKISSLPVIRGDSSLIRQVWVNLLSNAIKFTRPRQTAVIEVGGETEAAQTIYYVKDNGVGFDMQYVQKLFGVFQRLHPVEEFEGTGVGLAIVQRVVHRHGGRIWAEAALGQGATFCFTLPGEGGSS